MGQDPTPKNALAKQAAVLHYSTTIAGERHFRVVRKLPFSFSYHFVGCNWETEANFKILDWEIGALYWNCLKSARGDESVALAKVREKYFDTFLKTDLHFFLGTTQQWHSVAPNPWVIVGVLPIPRDNRRRLL